MKRASWTLGGTILISFLTSQRTMADQFHYHNFLIGDRAIGLGGAYGGVSDDASGVFYNPAGLAFALSNDVSGSANAFYVRKIVYKDAVGGQDFEEHSGGTLPSFFGGLQKLDRVAKGLVFAFGMYTTDGELKDQDDTIEHVTLGQALDVQASGSEDDLHRCNEYTDGVRTANEGAELPNVVLDRFHRTVNQRGSTYHVGAAVGWRATNNVAIGVGANYVTVDELVQEYQDVRMKSAICKTTGDYSDTVQQLSQNIRQHLTAAGIQPVFAIQAALWGRFSLGFTIKAGTYASQSFEQTAERRQTSLLATDQAEVDARGARGSAYRTAGAYGEVLQNDKISKLEAPLGSMPAQYRLGAAFFASTRLLMTFDVTYVAGVTNDDKLEGLYSLYGKEAVVNLAGGMEYFLVPAVPLRLGFFTNNDARPELVKTKTGQRDHIDYAGGTIFLAWVQPNSQIGAGVVLQKGDGMAQKVDGPAVQKVDGQSFTFAFSATHSF